MSSKTAPSRKEGQGGEALSPYLQDRKNITDEMVSSETVYKETLHVMVHVIQRSLVSSLQSGMVLLSEEEIQLLFRNVEVILALHEKLEESLLQRAGVWEQEGPESERVVSDIYIDYTPFLKCYTPYVNYHDDAIDAIRDIMKNKKYVKFQKFYRKLSSHPNIRGAPLTSLLISPIQRVPRYKLLLADLLKHTKPPHSDLQGLAVALRAIEDAANMINEELRASENRRKLTQLESEFVPAEALVSPTRNFVRKGELVKVNRKSMKKYTFFLFNDLILYAEPFGWRYRVHRRLVIDETFIVKEAPNTAAKNQFRFKIGNSTKTFFVCASTLRDKESWMADMLAQVKKSEHSRTGAPTLRPPAWQNEGEVSACRVCATKFSLLRRKHHCRHCGLIFCSDHVPKRPVHLPFLGPGITSARVCDGCHAILQDKMPDSQKESAETSLSDIAARMSVSNTDVKSFRANLESFLLSRAATLAEKPAQPTIKATPPQIAPRAVPKTESPAPAPPAQTVAEKTPDEESVPAVLRNLLDPAAQSKSAQWVWISHPHLSWVPAKPVAQRDKKYSLRYQTVDGEIVSHSDDLVVYPMSPSFVRFLDDSVEDLVHLDVTQEMDSKNIEEMNTPASASILHQLRLRYKDDNIYTSMGGILIAVNPLKMVPLYSASTLDMYRRTPLFELPSLPPHVWLIAASAYRQLCEYAKDQSIVISGESGSGKTETTKLIVQYLSEVAGKHRKLRKLHKYRRKRRHNLNSVDLSSSADLRHINELGESNHDPTPESAEDGIEFRLLQANPLLEAFGNAKTVRNDNSSRFGKWITIDFKSMHAFPEFAAARSGQPDLVSSFVDNSPLDPSSAPVLASYLPRSGSILSELSHSQGDHGHSHTPEFGDPMFICGGNVEAYLLEKTRVVAQSSTERNFHIFYQICQGAMMAKAQVVSPDPDHPPERKNSLTRAISTPSIDLKSASAMQTHLEFARKNSISSDVNSAETLSIASELWYLDSLKLGKPEDFHYLSNSGCYTIPGVDDARALSETLRAIRRIGFSSAEACWVLRILASILHIGNIEMKQRKSIFGRASLAVNEDPIAVAAEVMQVDPAELGARIRFQRVKVGVEVTEVPLDLPHAVNERDTLAKNLYSSLFHWIVARIDYLLSKDMDAHEASGPHDEVHRIGVLDIFGFEGLGTSELGSRRKSSVTLSRFFGLKRKSAQEEMMESSFEQFLINYANEKLQQLFINKVFKQEQAQYHKEGIEVDRIAYIDNQICLNLFETVRPVPGILVLLDEENRLRSSDDSKLMQRMLQSYMIQETRTALLRPAHPCFRPVKHSDHLFLVNHYAGQVMYNVTGFLEKNKDHLNDALLELLRSSRCPLIHHLFTVAPESMGLSLSESQAAVNESAKADARTKLDYLRNLEQLEEERKKSRNMSVGKHFQVQLNHLMQTLDASQTHFIRCIKPNSLKRPHDFHSPEVLRQLKSGGLVGALQIFRQGFPVRLSHQQFCTRFRAPFRYLEHFSNHTQYSVGRQSSRRSVYEHRSQRSEQLEADHDSVVSSDIGWVGQCAALLSAICSSGHQIIKVCGIDRQGFRIGKTQIFMTSAQKAGLETFRARARETAARILQKFHRQFIQRSSRQPRALYISDSDDDEDFPELVFETAGGHTVTLKDNRDSNRAHYQDIEAELFGQAETPDLAATKASEKPPPVRKHRSRTVVIDYSSEIKISELQEVSPSESRPSLATQMLPRAATPADEVSDEVSLLAAQQCANSYPLGQFQFLHTENANDAFLRHSVLPVRESLIRLDSPYLTSIAQLVGDSLPTSESEALWLSNQRAKYSSMAKDVFKNILSFSGERYHPFPATCAYDVLQAGIEFPVLRDEIYCQLIKQTSFDHGSTTTNPTFLAKVLQSGNTASPSSRHVHHAPGMNLLHGLSFRKESHRQEAVDVRRKTYILCWKLFFLCLRTFSPLHSTPYVLAHLARNPALSLKEMGETRASFSSLLTSSESTNDAVKESRSIADIVSLQHACLVALSDSLQASRVSAQALRMHPLPGIVTCWVCSAPSIDVVSAFAAAQLSSDLHKSELLTEPVPQHLEVDEDDDQLDEDFFLQNGDDSIDESVTSSAFATEPTSPPSVAVPLMQPSPVKVSVSAPEPRIPGPGMLKHRAPTTSVSRVDQPGAFAADYCVKCGHAKASTKFCLECGHRYDTPVPTDYQLYCQGCGCHRERDSVFCHECGVQFVTSRPRTLAVSEGGPAPSHRPSVTPTCPACNVDRMPGAKFCLECGEKLPPLE